MSGRTHEKKELVQDFSEYPKWMVSRPVKLDKDRYQVTLHAPWKKPVEGERSP